MSKAIPCAEERRLRLSAEAKVTDLEARLRESEQKYERLLHTHDDLTLPALYEAEAKLERWTAKAQRVKAVIGHWSDAYGPDLVEYPSRDEMQAVNETPEFRVGRNAMMRIIHDTLLPEVLIALLEEGVN